MNTKMPPPFDQFVWCGGIENTFIPQERPGLRALEEFELTQHYQQWRDDLDRAASLGIKALRWGPPWYLVEPRKGEFDWEFADKVIDYLVNVLRLTPVLDLVHYGTPLWMTDSFADPEYPRHVSEYAAALTKRYKHLVRFYTPLNEPIVNADFSGRRGEWPPYLTGDRGFVAVLMQIAKGIQLTAKAIRQEQPDAIFVAVEAMRRVKPIRSVPSSPAAQTRLSRAKASAEAHLHGLHDYLAYDLACGKVTREHPLYGWLIENGASEEALAALLSEPVDYDIMGVNFYPWSYEEVDVDDSGARKTKPGRCGGGQLFHVLKQAAGHSGKPLMITETSAPGTIEERRRWMRQTLSAVARARAIGIDVRGYTWFPLFTMIGWEYRASGRPIDEHLLHLGLWDCHFDEKGVLVRKGTPLKYTYKHYIAKSPID